VRRDPGAALLRTAFALPVASVATRRNFGEQFPVASAELEEGTRRHNSAWYQIN